jgi:hypothetical protein
MSASDSIVEQRLSVVEAAIKELRQQLAVNSAPDAPEEGVSRFLGAFQDEPAFAEVVAFGRQIREEDRPPYEDQQR